MKSGLVGVKHIPKNIIDNPEYYLDDVTKLTLDNVIERGLKQDYDCLIIICADKTGVGVGKSTLAMLICSYVANKLGNKFTPEYIIFDSMDYRFLEQKLKPMTCLQFDEAIDVFFSSNATTKDQKNMIRKFAKIRSQNYFIVMCIPSILMLSKWFRGVGQTRTNAIFRCMDRGVYKCYGKGSGTINRIKIDTPNNRVLWPSADYTGRWKKFPKTHPFFKLYEQKKNKYVKRADDNPKVIKAVAKEKKKLSNTFTVDDMASIKHVNEQTVHSWIRKGFFPKKAVFKDLTGRLRIKEKAFYAGVKRVEKWKITGKLPSIVTRHQAEMSKDKRKRQNKKKRASKRKK